VKLPRRQFLRLAAGAAALPAVSRITWAQAYPTRPVHLIVGYAAAGPSDITFATETVVRAPADGYTLLLVTLSNAISATLYDDLKFNFIRDIAPVASIMRAPSVMVVNPSVPATTVSEFIAYAKANPGKINMATAGNGSPPQAYGEMFKMMAGVDLASVAYRGGGPALVDLLGGQVQVMFESIASSIAYIRAGKLRALAVTTATRSATLPDVPTVAEFVPGYEASGWFGLGAPKNTPTQIIDKLNKEVNAALVDPNMTARIADLGGVPMSMTPTEFSRLIAEETEKWGKVIRVANIKPD